MGKIFQSLGSSSEKIKDALGLNNPKIDVSSSKVHITNWFRLLFSIRRSRLKAMFIRLLLLIGISVGCSVMNYYDIIPKEFSNSAHTLLGIALGLLMVYRTNASYDRFWEGRKLWGMIVNSFRNILRCIRCHEPSINLRPLSKLCLAYLTALKLRLRNKKNLSELRPFFQNHEQERFVMESSNRPLAISLIASKWIVVKCTNMDSHVLRSIENYMGLILDCMGGCERIMNTPVPFSYIVHIHHLLFLYLVTLPFVLVVSYGWYTPLAVALVGFGLLGIEEAGIEIQDPFGEDVNDLPLDALCDAFQKSVEIFEIDLPSDILMENQKNCLENNEASFDEQNRPLSSFSSTDSRRDNSIHDIHTAETNVQVEIKSGGSRDSIPVEISNLVDSLTRPRHGQD